MERNRILLTGLIVLITGLINAQPGNVTRESAYTLKPVEFTIRYYLI